MGFAGRKVDPNDGRRKRIRVTPRGYEMVAVGDDAGN
jgi:DNA-binding MarR family transcriptional regulator